MQVVRLLDKDSHTVVVRVYRNISHYGYLSLSASWDTVQDKVYKKKVIKYGRCQELMKRLNSS
jgi:hypothetical protein